MNLRNNSSFVFIIFLLSYSLHGQPHVVSSEMSITQYNPGLTKYPLTGYLPNPVIKQLQQIFIKSNGDIYMMPDGTGRLYKIDASNHDLRLVRQDSTIYYGATFGSYLFTYNDTIYSFGGYGYWKFNGQLRAFIAQKGDWELERLNREIPFSRGNTLSSPIWFSIQRSELWIGYSIDNLEGIKVGSKYSKIIDSVYVLNLKTRDWETKGSLNSEFITLLNSLSTKSLASTPWGQLIYLSESSEMILLDYVNNVQLKLKESIANQVIKLMTTNSINYFVDQGLVIQSGENWMKGDFYKGDTVKLSKADFIITSKTIYRPLEKSIIIDPVIRIHGYQLIIIGVITGIAISAISYFFILRIKSRKTKHTLKTDEIHSLEYLFDEKEKEVIQLIKMNSKNDLGTTIDQINQLIGVTLKNPEVQKKQRSDVLLSINDKWKRRNQSQNILIDKKRLEHDKRSYEYFIEIDNIEKILFI